MRRVAHEQFGSRPTERFQRKQEVEAASFALEICQHPQSWSEYLKK